MAVSFIGEGNWSTHRPAASHRQTLSHNVASSTYRLSGIRREYLVSLELKLTVHTGKLIQWYKLQWPLTAILRWPLIWIKITVKSDQECFKLAIYSRWMLGQVTVFKTFYRTIQWSSMYKFGFNVVSWKKISIHFHITSYLKLTVFLAVMTIFVFRSAK